MKKFITGLLVCTMVAGVCGCSKEESPETSEATTLVAVTEASNVAEPSEVTGNTDVIIEETIVETSIPEASTIPAPYQLIVTEIQDIITDVENEDLSIDDSEGDYWSIAQTAVNLGVNYARDNICYAMSDINNDGTPELIICTRIANDTVSDTSPVYRAGYSILNVYTINGSEAVLLVESTERSSCYINSAGQIIVIGSGGAAISHTFVYTLEANSSTLTEYYHLYTDYADDSMSITLNESYSSAPATVLDITDDPANSDMWNTISENLDQYTADMLQLNLVPVAG